MLLYICVKFHEGNLNGFLVTERTRFCDRRTDRRPGQKQYVSQPYGGGGVVRWEDIILKMSRFTFFGDQTFHGRICIIKLAESKIYLNKHFDVKITSIGQFVCK